LRLSAGKFFFKIAAGRSGRHPVARLIPKIIMSIPKGTDTPGRGIGRVKGNARKIIMRADPLPSRCSKMLARSAFPDWQ
jgi:hypothetical protein